MKKIKTIISSVLIILMVFSAMPLTAFADDTLALQDAQGSTDEYTWSYTAETGTVYINTNEGYTVLDGYASKGTLPMWYSFSTEEGAENSIWGDYSGNNVKHIIFGNNIEAIQNVTLKYELYPDLIGAEFEENSSIKELGSSVFKESRIKALELPEGLETIGNQCFYSCSFEDVTIPESVTKIGTKGFYASNLKKLTILGDPECDSAAFRYSTGLKEVSAVNVTKFYEYEFASCTNLETVDSGNGVEYICDYAFSKCTALTGFNFNEGLKEINQYAFDHTSIINVNLPSTLEWIGEYAFSGDTLLQTLNLNEGLEYISPSAFNGCSSLTTVDIASTIEQIDTAAFYNCTKLTTVTGGEGVNSIESNAFYYTSSLAEYPFSDKIAYVASQAFKYSGLTNLVIPDSEYDVTIGQNAFNSCKKLKTVTLYGNVISLGANAFQDCTALEEFTYAESKLNDRRVGFTQFITSQLFYNDYCLKKVNLPSAITVIGSQTFMNCGVQGSIFDFSNTNIEIIQSSAFNGCRSNIVLPDTVTTIGENAFNNCYTETINLTSNVTSIVSSAFKGSKLKSVDLSSTSITTINDSVFESCTNLESVILPKNCTYIGSRAFFRCTGLTDVTLNDKITGIGQRAFYDDTALESITFPSSLTSIKDYAFYNTGIVDADLSGVSGELYVGKYAFSECQNLTRAEFSQNQVTFAEGAFNNSSISNVVIPSSTYFSNEMFRYCVNLKGIQLPNNLSGIGTNAFSGTELTEITIPETVTSIGSGAFRGTPLAKVTFEGFIENDSTIFTESQLASTGLDENLNVVWHALNGTVFESYANNHDVPFIPIDGLEPGQGVEVVASGTWSGGGWQFIQSGSPRLFISGEGELTNEFIDSATGDSYNAIELLNKYSCSRIIINEGITSVPDNFIYSEDLDLENPITYIVVPSTVKSIGENAFRGSNITKITLSEGLESIGNSAFRELDITEIKIPNSVKTIGDYAFYGVGVSEFELSDNVQSIGKYAFANNEALTTLKLSESLTEIPEGAFYGTGIATVTIPENVNTIGKKAFGNCLYLVTVKLNNGRVDIYYDEINPSDNAIGFTENGSIANGSLIIYGAYDTASYDYASKAGISFSGNAEGATYSGIIPQTNSVLQNKPLQWFYYEDVKTLYIQGEGYINGDGLYYKDGTKFDVSIDIENVYICPGITQIHEMAAICNPRRVTIPGTVTKFTNMAFANCTNLYTITIPASVTSIDAKAFANCTSLAAVYFTEGVTKVPDNLFRGNISLQFVDFGGVTEIGRYAFYGCTNLQQIVLPDSVKTVDSYAFGKCISVQSITLGANIEKINDSAFSNLPLCETINFDSNAITSVAINAFKNSGASTTGMNVVYSNRVTTARLTGFDGVNVGSFTIGSNVEIIVLPNEIPSLKSIKVNSDNQNYYSYYGCLYDSTNTLLYAPQSLTAIDIKAGTKAIGSNAFSNSNISTVVIPKGVTEIQSKAFYNATQLKIVYFPNTVETIGDSAFENCSRLKTVDISYPVKSIGASAFRKCTSLASVILPDTLEAIGADCFNGCSSLTGIVIPENTASLGIGALAYCPNLVDVYVWYATIGYNAFKGSTNVNVYTMVGSNAYEYARANSIPYGAYTDEEMFYDECAIKIDALAGYLGFCADGHGDIQWLSVYEADCENDGYMIGVCEYCSEILEEKHIDATGHNYRLTADIPATQNTKGMKVYTCSNCNDSYCEYTEPTGSDIIINTVTVSGRVVIATNKSATEGKTPAKNVSVVIDGYTVATTDADGNFTFEIETGTYEVQLKYAYGFTRSVYLVAEDEDITVSDIPIIGCDFNKDGKIDNADLNLFQYVVSASANDPSYLEFVDMNNDGYINAKDRMYIVSCKGIDSSTYTYESIIIQK